MLTTKQAAFYIYLLARPNGQPFYIGKGKGRRIFKHEEEARRGCQCLKCNIIRKIWRNGGEVQRYIVFTTDDESEAYAYEAEMIAHYGINSLSNLHAGGKGGINPKASTRTKLAAINKARYADPLARADLSRRMKAVLATPEARAQRKAAAKLASSTAEVRARMSDARRRAWTNPEIRAQWSAGRKAAWEDAAYRAQQSAARRATWDDPEVRAKRSAGIKAAWARRKAASCDDN